MDRSTADTRHGFARLARFGKALRAFARDAAKRIFNMTYAEKKAQEEAEYFTYDAD